MGYPFERSGRGGGEEEGRRERGGGTGGLESVHHEYVQMNTLRNLFGSFCRAMFCASFGVGGLGDNIGEYWEIGNGDSRNSERKGGDIDHVILLSLNCIEMRL